MKHIPVMLKEIGEIVESLGIESIADVTYGGGGHTKLFRNLGLQVFSMDRDKVSDSSVICDKFSNIGKYIEEIDIVFADLGMSTLQIEGGRGFSYRADETLDMRMDDSGAPLHDRLKFLTEEDIKRIIRNYGEEKMAAKIAKNIVLFRLQKEILTTQDLVKATQANDYKTLSKVFQSFRIFINEELKELEILLKESYKISKAGVMFLSFHSLEDRLVKRFIKNNYLHSSLIYPSEEEISINSPSRSAKLRIGLKI